MIQAPFFKIPPIRDRRYLDFLRTQQCLVTGRGETEPAHLRLLGAGGTGIKPGDNLAVPLNHELHRYQSQVGEPRAWLEWAQEYPEFYFRLIKFRANAMYQMWSAP